MYSSQCLGCTGTVQHKHIESVAEHAYCDNCLKELNLPPRGTYKALVAVEVRRAPVDPKAWLVDVNKIVDDIAEEDARRELLENSWFGAGA